MPKIYSDFYKIILKYPVLPKHEQLELIKQAKMINSEDEQVKQQAVKSQNKLVMHSLGLIATACSTKMRNLYKVSFDYLIADGTAGIIKAIQMFDITSGYCFTTYAMWWIRAELGKSVQQQKSPIVLPAWIFCEYSKIMQVKYALLQANEPVTLEKLAKGIGKSTTRVSTVLQAIAQPYSFDFTYTFKDSDAETSMLDTFISKEDEFTNLAERDQLESLLSTLDRRDREHLEVFYQIKDVSLAKGESADDWAAKQQGKTKGSCKNSRHAAVKKLKQLVASGAY